MYCDNCGKPNSRGAVFCGDCGYKLGQDRSSGDLIFNKQGSTGSKSRQPSYSQPTGSYSQPSRSVSNQPSSFTRSESHEFSTRQPRYQSRYNSNQNEDQQNISQYQNTNSGGALVGIIAFMIIIGIGILIATFP